MSRWSPEREGALATLAGAGLSCAAIAEELGVSRNAVIGKLYRLRQARPVAPPPRPAPPARALRAVYRAASALVVSTEAIRYAADQDGRHLAREAQRNAFAELRDAFAAQRRAS